MNIDPTTLARRIAWLAILGAAVLIATRLLGKVANKAAI